MGLMLLQTNPRPPALIDSGFIPGAGSTIVVPNGGDFQAALNAANPGDTITLNAGSTYSGNFILPAKGGSQYIHVRSSAALTAEGSRVTTSQLSAFPKVVTPNGAAALQAAAGSSYYRFINCDIKTGATAIGGHLVGLGTGSETNSADFPHHFIIDRCGVRGGSTNGGRRGVLFSGSYQAVIDSYLSDWKEVGADTQAICGWTGYGPYKIVNNYIEGAGENVMFGGADTAIANLTPSDIEVRGNLFYKPFSWWTLHPSYSGTHWSVKNIFELKHAKRVLVENNIFENCWSDGQNGYAIVFTVRNQSGGNPWATVSDVTFRLNTIRHSANGVNCLGYDNESGVPSQYARRLLMQRNLFYDIGFVPADGDGNLFQLQYGYDYINIDHNTGLSTRSTVLADGLPMSGFKFTNNIVDQAIYGVFGSGYSSGNPTIDHFFPGYVFSKNAMIGPDNTAIYPAGQFFPATRSDVGFVNLTGYEDLRLAPSSPYKGMSLEGDDVGADIPTPA